MIIIVKTISNKQYEIILNPSNTVNDIKKKLVDVIGIPEEKLQLIFKAKVIESEKTIDELGISDRDVLVVYTQTAKVVKPAPEVLKTEPIKESSIPVPIIEEEKVSESNVINAPHSSPLQLFIEQPDIPDPPDFNEKVSTLLALGFSKGDCEKALRAAVFNPNRAADFLLTGYIPEPPRIIKTEETVEEDYDFADEEEEIDLNRIVRKIKDDPDALKDFLDDMINSNPGMAPIIRDDPAAFLASLGIDPSNMDLSRVKKRTEYEILMSRFNNEEQNAIHRLEKLGFDTMTVLQVFEACDHNEELCAACLSEMK